MSRQSYKAARSLQQLRNHRSCISRAYFAAFAAVTHELRKRTHDFPRGFEHPPHVQVGRFVKRHLTQLSASDRLNLRTVLDRLRLAREAADYRHVVVLADGDARKAMIDARYVLTMLGVI